jgi:hypothetical protein
VCGRCACRPGGGGGPADRSGGGDEDAGAIH